MSNVQVFASLATEVGNIDDCAQLQACVDRAMAQFVAQYAGINSQITALAPIAGLLTNPTNLSEVITWITNFSSIVLGPQYAAYLKYVTELAELIAAVATFTTEINNAASRIGSCTITIPPL